jgi:nitrate reductase cytochrome c-type subunit
MKTTTKTSRTLISMAVGVIALVATVVSAGAESCFLAQQLTDPTLRSQYEQKIAEAQAAATSRYGESYNYSVSFTMSSGEKVTIDSFSLDCILCHDGMNAKYHDIRYRNDHNDRISLESVLGSHPIGMSYGAMAYANAKLRHLSSISGTMVLVDGRVGCLSCHNLLNPEKFHLSSTNDKSELCLQCHVK